jgi:hypothetical protein
MNDEKLPMKKHNNNVQIRTKTRLVSTTLKRGQQFSFNKNGQFKSVDHTGKKKQQVRSMKSHCIWQKQKEKPEEKKKDREENLVNGKNIIERRSIAYRQKVRVA